MTRPKEVLLHLPLSLIPRTPNTTRPPLKQMVRSKTHRQQLFQRLHHKPTIFIAHIDRQCRGAEFADELSIGGHLGVSCKAVWRGPECSFDEEETKWPGS